MIWLCVAAVALSILLVRMVESLRSAAHRHSPLGGVHRPRHKLVEMGSEWEEFYVPGDRILKGDDRDDFE